MNGNSMVDAWTMPSRLSQVRNAENRSRQVSGLGTRKWKVNGDRIYDIYIYSYSGLWYLLVRTLLEHYGAYQNPMETLHKPYTNPLFFPQFA